MLLHCAGSPPAHGPEEKPEVGITDTLGTGCAAHGLGNEQSAAFG